MKIYLDDERQTHLAGLTALPPGASEVSVSLD